MFVPIGFYSPTVAVVTSAYYTADVWGLTDTNTVIGAYSKNSGACEVGKYYRGPENLYVSEALCKSSSMVTALSGKTIQDFQIEYTVTTNNLFGGTDAPIGVFKCDVDWTDNPTTAPRYNNPFPEYTAWATTLVTDSLVWTSVTPTGTKVISKSSAQTSLVQSWANGTVTNNGVILGMNNLYFGYNIILSGVRFWVQYI